ncbi:hypothetical protein TNCV_3975211 [Trichonephila clavipes]|nr:hypothetical protein TNCV_3975211 [Trichonephila clavipes]
MTVPVVHSVTNCATFASPYGFREPSTYESTIAQHSPSGFTSCLGKRAQKLECRGLSVYGHHTAPTNLTELWTALANIWQVIPVERFQKLVESMLRLWQPLSRSEEAQLVTRISSNHRVHFQWVPYHVEIDGNDKFDFLARTAAEENFNPIGSFTFSEFSSL